MTTDRPLYTDEMKPWERKLGYLLAMIPMGALTIISSNAWFDEGYSGWNVVILLLAGVNMLLCCLQIVAIDLETALKKALKEAPENRHE